MIHMYAGRLALFFKNENTKNISVLIFRSNLVNSGPFGHVMIEYEGRGTMRINCNLNIGC